MCKVLKYSILSALQAGGRWFESNSSHTENKEVTKVTSFFRFEK